MSYDADLLGLLQTLEALDEATGRLVGSLDALSEADLAGDSLLPGWTRAHVVAHLALNAEALGHVVSAVSAGRPTAMYASQESRDGDIAALATARPSALRRRLLAGTTDLTSALRALPQDRADVEVPRTPGSPMTFRAGDALPMRWREVEIHHVDLDAGHDHRSWPESFCERLVTDLVGRGRAGVVSLRASDLDRTWQAGHGGPTVVGSAADLGWWLTGRGDGTGLTTDGGVLPRIEAW